MKVLEKDQMMAQLLVLTSVQQKAQRKVLEKV